MGDITYITKANIGDTIYCIPTHNAVNRKLQLEKQIREFKLLNVTKTRFSIEVTSFGKLNKESHQFDGLDKHNRGFMPFATKELALKYLSHSAYLGRLRDNCRVSKLTLEQIDKIIEITGELNG